MFIELEAQDVIQVAPRNIQGSPASAIKEQLNAYYTARYVPKVGIFVTTTEIIAVLDKKVMQQDPTIHFDVKFRAVFFRPFRNEVIEGTIGFQNERGIQVCLQFFNSVFIPAQLLPEGTEYLESEGVWVWRYQEQEFFFDNFEKVRLRVVDIQENAPYIKQQDGVEEDKIQEFVDHAQFVVIGAMNESGLGSVRWWV